jgi:hypothetical protein
MVRNIHEIVYTSSTARLTIEAPPFASGFYRHRVQKVDFSRLNDRMIKQLRISENV